MCQFFRLTVFLYVFLPPRPKFCLFSSVVARSAHGRRAARHQHCRIRHVGRLETFAVGRTHAHHELELPRVPAGASLCDARDVGMNCEELYTKQVFTPFRIRHFAHLVRFSLAGYY